jgi:hypothetical protein
VNEEDKTEVNNRPVAIDDKATTDANVPVEINILRNDKDSDGDKLSIMGLSPPIKGKIESNSDGVITYTPSEWWSGTEKFGYSISDGRGGIASASVIVIVQPTRVENEPPEAQDQDITINGNNPVKIKLDAKDPDDGKLRFVLVSKPSHGRIVQFSSSTGTLAYVPDENYDGKDEFAFKVHDGTAFSKDAKVSIKIENNEKSSNDQQPKKEEPSQTRPMSKRLMMRRAIAIPLQTIRANRKLLQLKMTINRKKIKRQKSNSLVPQISIQATPTPLLVATVSQLLIHR